MPRLLTIPDGEDFHEWFQANYCADGLPMVPPTPSRVAAMLTGTMSPSHVILGTCPPSYDPVSIEAVAVAAVMAGCAPAHFSVVLAAVQAALTPEFNFHGNHATTMGATPCVLVSGPAAAKAGVNCDLGCLGAGTRANAAIGRALKVVLYTVGGARLGGSESSTLGSPMKYTFCFAENEDALASLGPWKPYRTECQDGKFSAAESVATVLPVTAFNTIVDFQCSTPDEVVAWIARTVVHGGWATRLPVLSSGLLVLSPEHYELVSRKYRTRSSFQHALWRQCNLELAPHVGAIVAKLKFPEGSGLGHCLTRAFVGGACALASVGGFYAQSLVPKMESPQSLHVVVAGGLAGKFSVFCPGFGAGFEGMSTRHMSMPVSRRIDSVVQQQECPEGQRAEAEAAATTSPSGAAPSSKTRGGELTGGKGLVIYDPLGPHGGPSTPSPSATLAPRSLHSLQGSGVSIALLDISKGGSKTFLDRTEALLRTKFASSPLLTVRRFVKPTFNRPAPSSLRKEVVASGCTHVVAALAD